MSGEPAPPPSPAALPAGALPELFSTAPEPQWGEAYLLFDGDYRSLDDFLRARDG
ncbi:MAG TPA: hypothetical protein VFE37_22465 [Chloroflexota bacterium]|nr:hypothetical protein [Chloroflexota bacterium]